MRDLKRKDKLVEAAGDAYGKTLSLAVMDVCNDESVKQCIDGIKDRHVDVLINNAGISLVGPVESISIEEMKELFETNFFGVIRVIKEVMPDMKKRRGGHIIVMSSVLGLHGAAFHDVYAATKYAIEGFCESLALQLMKFNVAVSMMEPGPVHTDFEMKMIEEIKQRDCPGADPETVYYFKNVYLRSVINIFEAVGQTPDEIAKSTKKVIEASKPSFHNLTNPLITPIVALKYADKSGDLTVRALYHGLFSMGPLLHYSVITMKLLTGRYLRSSTVSPS